MAHPAPALQRLFLPRRSWLQAQAVPPSSNPKTSHVSNVALVLSALPYLLVGFLLAVPVVVYYLTIYQNAYNFPYEDDLNSALEFVDTYVTGRLSAWEKLTLIFSQYNEHRIVFDRLAFLTDYALFGQVNFRHLILVGNLAPLLIGYLFVRVPFRNVPPAHRLFFLIPVAYTLFSFQYWELTTWSMAALQNLFVVPMAMGSLYSLCRPGNRAFGLACAMAVLATFTSGNGLFTFVTGAGMLLLLGNYRNLGMWLLVSGLTIGLYFVGYMRPPYHPDIADSLLNHTGRAIRYFFTLTGSLVNPDRTKLVLLFGGFSLLVTLGLLGWLAYKKRFAEHLPVIGWLAFFYLTCLSLMASRSGMGVEQAFSPRYGIVVVLVFATQAVLAIETVTHRYGRWLVAGLYALLSLYFYTTAPNRDRRHYIQDRNRQMRYNTALYYTNPAKVSLHWGNSTVAGAIFRQAIQHTIYQLPTTTFQQLSAQPRPFNPARLISAGNVINSIKPYVVRDYVVFYRAWATVAGTPTYANVQIIARSADNCYSFDTQRHYWNDVGDNTLGGGYTQPGFSCVLDKKSLKPGRYALWLQSTMDGHAVYSLLTRSLDI